MKIILAAKLILNWTALPFLFILFADTAHAQFRERLPVYETGSKVVLQSAEPYWRVGRLSRQHSTLCANGRFNQVKKNDRVLQFTGPVGNGVLGLAKGNGWNLYDPGRRAVPDADYFFRNDGTGSCEVYYFQPDQAQPAQ